MSEPFDKVKEGAPGMPGGAGSGAGKETNADQTKLLRSSALQTSSAILAAQHRAEQELLQTKEVLAAANAWQRTILDSAAVSIISTDPQGVIQTFNAAAERMLGYRAEEVVGKTTLGVLHDPEEVQRGAAELTRELGRVIEPGFEVLVVKTRSGAPEEREWTYLRKDGSRFPVRLSVTAIFDAAGRITGFMSIATDLTEHKQVEETLLKAGALQNAIFNSANFSIIATDAKGVIQIFNVGAERMLGYAADDVLNKITPADISDPQEVIARAKALSVELGTPIAPGFEALVFKASRGIEDIYELTYFRKDGSRFPAVVSITALRDAQDVIIGYLLIGTDNTARKQVEEERQKLDQRLRDQHFYTRSLIESNIDALMATDPRGIITDVNKQTEALTGCTRDELIGAPFKNYFTDLSRAEAGINRVLTEGKVTNYELTARARDGKETEVSYNATTFYDRDRRLQGVFAAARDVTAQKQASQYARSLIEASLDPLVTISATGKITDVNDASVQATGVPREQLIGTDFCDYFTEPEKAREGYQQVFAKGFVTDYPLTIRHKDGRLANVLYNASVYKDARGNVLGVFAAARDVTGRKRAEAEIARKNMELEQANRAKSNFLATMSHELRTPLNAIIGFTGVVLQQLAGPLNLEQTKQLEMVRGSARHLLALINDVLDISKIEARQLEVASEPFDLRASIEKVVGIVAPLTEKKGLVLRSEIAPEVGQAVGDARRVEQILINLLNNAVKFTDRGSVTLSAVVRRSSFVARQTRYGMRDTWS